MYNLVLIQCFRNLSSNALSKPLCFRPAKLPPLLRENTYSKHVPTDKWGKIFKFVCIPALIASYINAYWLGDPPTRPIFKPWQGSRPVDVSWSPFYNKYLNAGPEGYETTDEEFLEYKKKHTPRWSKHKLGGS
ncbi:hypothetical protein GJ496_005729 [Pomphorhynchus laevis]|nr:hypothetical protein GJ496_005729 [Pomphorhynchus laevis]